MGGQNHAPADLPTEKTRYPLYWMLGGPQGRSGRARKISNITWFELGTVQSVARVWYENWENYINLSKDQTQSALYKQSVRTAL